MTQRTGGGRRVRAPLTELENEVMSAVWAAGPSSVEAVHQAVLPKRKLKEATIRTLLRRLELKGYLRHKAEGRAYIYHAAEPARSLAARAVRQIIDGLCQGSVEELVSGMVDAKVLSKGELDKLAEFVRMRREGGER
jgi:predicted transcriptional regulator